jgi:AcrR family transcriptional regulator
LKKLSYSLARVRLAGANALVQGHSNSEAAQRRRILEAMIDSCAEKTYAATTIADIVSRAKVSRTTFYKRFADKRDCFEAAVWFSVEQLREVAAAAPIEGGSPADAARRSATAVLVAMAERPALAQLLTCDAVAVDPAVVERCRRLVTAAVAALWEAGTAPVPPSVDPGLAFGQAQVLVFHEIAAGRSHRLLDLLPQIAYLAVVPFAGHPEALRQSLSAERYLRELARDAGR